MDITTLEVFDFDWTLFRSPFPPTGNLLRHSWWNEAVSLCPPHVPLHPGKKFWIEEVVREMKASKRRPKSFTALLTGRREKTADRIRRLLEQQSLSSDLFETRPKDTKAEKDIIHFKRKKIIEILDAHPTINKIVMWEDLEEQIANIKELAKRRKLEFAGHLVTEVENLFLEK